MTPREICRAYGLTMEELQGFAGVKGWQLYLMISGRRPMDAQVRERLMGLLDGLCEARRKAEYREWLERCKVRARLYHQLTAMGIGSDDRR